MRRAYGVVLCGVTLLWRQTSAQSACGCVGSTCDHSANTGRNYAPPACRCRVDRQLELNGIGFHVTSPNVAAGNTVNVAPAGLEIDNSPFTWDADGAVTGAGVADLDTDGSPEIYVFVTSTDAAARGSVVAFSGNKRKSPSSIYLPPMAETPAAAQGLPGTRRLRGRLRFAGARQLQYKLVPGEAGWLLKLDRKTDF